MTVSQVGYTQGAFSAFGTFSVAWPSGTAVGHSAWFVAATGSDKKPTTVFPAGWKQVAVKSDGTSLWWKMLAAADIAAPLTIKARIELGVVLAGAAGPGKVGAGESLTITQAGGAHLLAAWRSTSDDLTVGKIHAADVVNTSYTASGVPRRYNLWLNPMAAAGVSYIDTNGSAFFSVEILPRTKPFVAEIVYPKAHGNYIDAGSTITIRWKHRSGSESGAQAYASVRLDDGPTPSAATITWLTNATETVIGGWKYHLQAMTDEAITYTVPSSGMYWLRVATAEDPANPSDYQNDANATVPVIFIYPKPTVAVTATVTGRSVAVGWTPTLTGGSSQASFRVRITPSAATNPDAPLYDSGIQAGSAATWTPPTDTAWTNGATYKAWVDLGQSNGQQTVPTASSAFTVSWMPPSAPTSVVINTAAHPATITANGLTGKERLRIEFTTDSVQRTIFAAVTAASMTLDLPLAPYGISTAYAVSASQTVDGVEMWSDPVTQTATAWDPNAYLVSTDGTEHLPVVIYSDEPRQDTEGILTFAGLGSSRASVVRTPSQGHTGQTTLIARTQAATIALGDWLTAHTSFAFRWPPERDKTNTLANVAPTKVARTSPLSEERIAQVNLQHRLIPISWIEQ